jgi:four helix bundle protein
LDYQLILASDLGFLGPEQNSELKAKVDEVQRMLASLIRKVKATR